MVHGSALLYAGTEEFNDGVTKELGRASGDLIHRGARIRQNHLTLRSIIDQDEQVE